MTYRDLESALEASITAFDHGITEEGSILTGWVVVAEFMDTDGVPRLETWAAEGLPYWRINGMVQAAADEIIYLIEDPEDVEDE